MPLFRRKVNPKAPSTESSTVSTVVPPSDGEGSPKEPKVEDEEEEEQQLPKYDLVRPGTEERRPKRPILVSQHLSEERRFSQRKPAQSAISPTDTTRPVYCGHDKHCCTWYEHTVALIVDFFKWDCCVFRPFVLFFILLAYTFVGAVVMWIMERHYTMYFWDPDRMEQDAIIERLWHGRMTMSKDVWKATVTKTYMSWARESQTLDNGVGWSYLDAVFYCLGVCCASHAANLQPRTIGGRIFTMVYALVGIPLYLLAGMEVGRQMYRVFCVLTRWLLSSVKWFTSMFTGLYGRSKAPTYEPPNVSATSCKMVIFMAFLYCIIGGMSVIGTARVSLINLMYYSFASCACLEISEVFQHSSILLPFLVFQIGGMALFSVMFEVIQAAVCDRLPCSDPDICEKLRQHALFLAEGSEEEEEVEQMGIPLVPSSASSSSSVSRESSISLNTTSSEQEQVAQARMDVTMKKDPAAARSTPARRLKSPPPPEPTSRRKRFPFGRKGSEDRLKKTGGSV